MILETDRLVLSTWQSSDWIAFRPIATDVEVMRYITGGVPWTDERIQLFVNRQVELFLERGFCRWKLLLKPSQEMIGFCGAANTASIRIMEKLGPKLECKFEKDGVRLVRYSIDRPLSYTTPRFKSSSG
jgi:RimJ/RimL family protein N-acetyltransferase